MWSPYIIVLLSRLTHKIVKLSWIFFTKAIWMIRLQNKTEENVLGSIETIRDILESTQQLKWSENWWTERNSIWSKPCIFWLLSY